MKRIILSAICLLSFAAAADISKVVVYPPSVLATCPSVKSTFIASPSYNEVSAVASDSALTLTFKGKLRVCDQVNGNYKWQTVNPYDYYVSYVNPQGEWKKRHEVISTDVNPANGINVTVALWSQALSDVGALKAYNNGFKGSVNFDLDALLTDADRGALNDGQEVTKKFSSTIAINSTTYLEGQRAAYAQTGNFNYANVNVDVTFKNSSGQNPAVTRVTVY